MEELAKQHLNIVELCTINAHLDTMDVFGDRTWIDKETANVYSQEAQQYFNNRYDEYYTEQTTEDYVLST